MTTTTLYTLETTTGQVVTTTRYRVTDDQRVVVDDGTDEMGCDWVTMDIGAARDHARSMIRLSDAHSWTIYTVTDLPTRPTRRRADRHFRRRAARLVALDAQLQGQ